MAKGNRRPGPRPQRSTLPERLLKNLGIRGDDECWEWRGKILPNGYGHVSGSCKDLLVHRVMLEIALMRPLEPGECACHRCNNRKCGNPDHLYVGTQSDNIKQAVRDGRWVNNGGSRLTSDAVIAMREKYATGTVPATQLAEEYGVNVSVACKIVRGKSWHHVGGPIVPAGEAKRVRRWARKEGTKDGSD